jgi:hypothetical protein
LWAYYIRNFKYKDLTLFFLFFLYKSGQTVASDFFKGIRYFKKLSADIRHSNVVYGGDESYTRENTRVISWRDLPGYEQPVMEELKEKNIENNL